MKKSVFSSVVALALTTSFLLSACDTAEGTLETSGKSAVGENAIVQVELLDVVAPVKNQIPATELLVPETADYTAGAIEWQNAETDEVVSSEATFTEGVSYRALVPLTAKEGKTFAASPKAAVGQIQIGDSESEIESCEITVSAAETLHLTAAEEAILTVTYKATPAKPAIKTMRGAKTKAYVLGLRAPAIGEIPRNLSLDPDDADYPNDYDDNKSGILSVPYTNSAGFTVVYDPDQTKWLNADTPFVAGKEYKAQITLQASTDRVFGDKLDALFGYTTITNTNTSSDLEDNHVFAQKESSVSTDRKTVQVVLTFKALEK